MKKFEYYCWYDKTPMFTLNKQKIRDEQTAELNRLGAEGWQYCFTGNDCLVFIREKEDQ